MTLHEIRKRRPEGWKEVTELYLSRQIKSKEACDRLGISPALFFRLLHRDNPERKNLRVESAKKIGKANKKHTTYLEQTFSDYELCMMMKARNHCDVCPLTCKQYNRYKGLGEALVKRVLINDETKLNNNQLQ